MKCSEHALHCKEVLLRKPNNQEDAIDTRNYLMFMVSAQNANRAGLIENITVTDLRDNEKLDGKRAIHIASHKTVTTYGGKGMLENPVTKHSINVIMFLRRGYNQRLR